MHSQKQGMLSVLVWLSERHRTGTMAEFLAVQVCGIGVQDSKLPTAMVNQDFRWTRTMKWARAGQSEAHLYKSRCQLACVYEALDSASACASSARYIIRATSSVQT